MASGAWLRKEPHQLRCAVTVRKAAGEDIGGQECLWGMLETLMRPLRTGTSVEWHPEAHTAVRSCTCSGIHSRNSRHRSLGGTCEGVLWHAAGVFTALEVQFWSSADPRDRALCVWQGDQNSEYPAHPPWRAGQVWLALGTVPQGTLSVCHGGRRQTLSRTD